jgi:hypothetical protein
MHAYSPALLLPAALLLIAAQKPTQPSGDLTLDAANPVIVAQVAGVTLRLRVDLDQHDNIELNPAAAARLTLAWEGGLDTDVGRVRLQSRVATAVLRIGERELPSQVTEHGRDCCVGTDGAIGPNLLPFATVRWLRADAPAPTDAKTLAVTESPMFGLSVPGETPKLRLRFALGQPDTIGTAAAGALLAQGYGGHWQGEPGRVTLAFGVSRPARTIAFTREVRLGGFRFDRLLLRISDFAGDGTLPADPVDPGDVIVARHLERQRAWPAVTLGQDRLSRCAEIVYAAVPRTLTLRCAFD